MDQMIVRKIPADVMQQLTDRAAKLGISREALVRMLLIQLADQDFKINDLINTLNEVRSK